MPEIENNINQIKDLCQRHNVETLYLFGSRASGNFSQNSDYDFLVRFKAFELKKYFRNYMSLKENLKKILKSDIDLLEEQTLKNPYLIRSIERNKQLIYG